MEYRLFGGGTSARIALSFLIFSTSFAASAGAYAASAGNAAKYTVAVLGLLPNGTYTLANAINNAGQVVGQADDLDYLTLGPGDVLSGPATASVRWDGTKPTIVEQGGANFPQLAFDPFSTPTVYGINNRGEMVGGSGSTEQGAEDLACGGLDEGWDYSSQFLAEGSTARAINDNGEIVGNSQVGPFGPLAPTYWKNCHAPYTLLATLPGAAADSSGDAISINGAGQIVGYASFSNGTTQAVIWTKPGEVSALPTLGGKNSAAQKISKSGHIVGWAETAAGAEHAVLWYQGKIKDLGTLGGKNSYASGINTEGDVVGSSQHTGCCTTHAVLWPHTSGKPVDLNTQISATDASHFELVEAMGITLTCQIVVNGYDKRTYAAQSYVLTPGSCDSIQ